MHVLLNKERFAFLRIEFANFSTNSFCAQNRKHVLRSRGLGHTDFAIAKRSWRVSDNGQKQVDDINFKFKGFSTVYKFDLVM